MSFAAAISYHPVTAQAVGEVVGQVLETLGSHPDLVVLFATPHHAPTIEAAARAVNTLLSPTALLGGISTSVLANGSALERGPALALWAANVGPIRTFALDPTDGWRVPDWLRHEAPPATHEARRDVEALAASEPRPAFVPRNVLALTEPSAPGRHLQELFSTLLPGKRAFGGALHHEEPFATAGAETERPAATARPQLLLGPQRAVGAVGVAFGGGLQVSTHVVSGTVPIGPPMVVTETSGHTIIELDGQAARTRLLAVALDAVAFEDLSLLATSLYVTGVGSGEVDGLCPVVASDRRAQTISLAGAVLPGSTVRFVLPASDTEVAAQTAQLLERASVASSALIFPAAGRFRALVPAEAEAAAGPSGLSAPAPLLDPLGARAALLDTLARLPAIGCACAPPVAPVDRVLEGHPLGVVVALLSTSTREFTGRPPFGHCDSR